MSLIATDNVDCCTNITFIHKVNTAIEQLLEVEDVVKGGILSPTTKAVGMARLGQKTQKVFLGRCPFTSFNVIRVVLSTHVSLYLS